MERNKRDRLWAILSAMAGLGLLALVYFSTQSDAQWLGKKTTMKWFVEGTEWYKKGEYENADKHFKHVLARKHELTPALQNDLYRWIEFNNVALAGRQRFEETLIRAENFFKQNRMEEVRRCINELKVNPYGSATQRERLRQLECMFLGCPQPTNYKELLKSAQIAFKNGLLEPAELLARSSIEMRPAIHMPTFDTPERLIEQIQQERERLAHPGAERKGGIFKDFKSLIWGKDPVPPSPPANGPPPFGPAETPLPNITNYPNDGPQPPPQIQVQPGGTMPPTSPYPLPPRGPMQQPYPVPPMSQPYPVPAPQPPPTTPGDQPQPLPQPPMSYNGWRGPGLPAVRMSQEDLPTPPSVNGDVQQVAYTVPGEDSLAAEKRRMAVAYVRDAEHALDIGDLNEALRKANMAKDLQVKFRANEPSPERVIREVYLRQGGPPAASDKPGDAHKPGGSAAAAPNGAGKPQDPKALLRQARELLKKEKFDEAQRLIAQAAEASPRGWDWPLFGDSPEKLQRELNRLRASRDKEKAGILMIEARKLFKQGRIVDARALALEAKALHGPYYIYERGERPQHLLDEIYKIELKGGIIQHVANKQDIKDKDVKDSEPPASPIVAPEDIVKRKQAEALLSEARALQELNRLVEAKAKLIEANKLGAVFGPNEPSPASMMHDLASLCNKWLNRWCQEGLEAAERVSDPDRFQKALGILKQAQALCLEFGQDPNEIDRRIGYVLQLQGQTPPPPPEWTPLQKEGLALLNQARNELAIGNLAVARKMAMEAFAARYGIQQQAQQVLLSIQAVDHDNQVRAAHEGARDGRAAFLRKEYVRAAEIFKNVKLGLLSPTDYAMVREILASEEMRPSNLAREQATPFAVDRPGASGGTKRAPGTASAGDSPADIDRVTEVHNMEKVQYDMYRSQSIATQQQAIDLFHQDPAQAIVLLENFLARLKATNFDDENKARLITPIQIRIDQYRRHQAQAELERKVREEAAQPVQPVEDGATRERLLRESLQQTQEEVAKLIKEAGVLYKQHKYEDALVQYERANHLLPDLPWPIQGIEMCKIKIRERDFRSDKAKGDRVNDIWLHKKNQFDNVPTPDKAVIYPPDFDKRRPQNMGPGLPGLDRSQAERTVEAKLREPVSLDFRNTELREALHTLRAMTGLNIHVDTRSLKEVGIREDSPITARLEGIELRTALSLLLKEVSLTYFIHEDVVVITTEQASHGNQVQRVYNITDLVVPIPDYPTSTFNNLHDAFRRHVAGAAGIMTNQASPQTPNFGLPPGPVVSGGYQPGGVPAQMAGSPGQVAGYNDRAGGPEMAQQLQTLIQDCVAQHTWKFSGGRGTMNYYPLGNALVVNQTQDVHDQIASLLYNLRRMQEVQVAIEMRVLTMSDQYFDLVNMNFEIGNTSAFASAPGLIAGMAPAGTAPDMSIPLRSIAAAFGTPPFAGALLGSGSVAIGAGFSFLNEIQVKMFMDAARADRRTQQLANPRLTVLNGATANIAVDKYKFFNTGAFPVQNGSQMFFMPSNNPFPYGINMQVTPIVSADRRFVRLHLVPSITNLISNNVPTIPIEIPVSQPVEGRDGGFRTSVVKMLYQQPEFDQVSLNTTVNVPDGGTVLLGGLKTMAEVRSESGPPVLSNIPLFSRLFRNTNYTRETRTLLILVTPHVIINEDDQPQPTQQAQQAPVMPTATH